MKRLIISLYIFIIITSVAQAQLWKMRRIEAGAGIGTSQFYGDIGGFSRGENMFGLKDFTYKQTRFDLNLNARYRIIKNVSARVNFNLGSFHATDERGANPGRKYEMTASFTEYSVIGEYYYLKSKSENSFLMMKGRRVSSYSLFEMMDCYVFAGFGGILYSVKPNAVLAPATVKTSGFAPVIPAGLGANLVFSPTLNFGIEIGGRYAFSDNLDAYTSEFSQKNDIYYFFNVNCIYKIKTLNRNRRR
jgi:hypothetical protein